MGERYCKKRKKIFYFHIQRQGIGTQCRTCMTAPLSNIPGLVACHKSNIVQEPVKWYFDASA
jgi:hypothetical protein